MLFGISGLSGFGGKMYQIGLIGIGHWGPNIAKSLELTGNAKVRWLCDSNNTACEKITFKYPDALTTTDIGDVLADENVDAVVISTPTVTHYELTKMALEAGKHVLVEKPITDNSAQAIELLELAQKRKKLLMVGHVFEYNATIRTLKKMIDDGELGEIHYINFERTNLGPVRTDVSALWDLATHDISIIIYFMGKTPRTVTATGHSWLNQGIEDAVFATFAFDDGPLAHVHASWLNPRKVRQITVVGSKKMVVWDDLDMNHPIRIYDKSVTTDENGNLNDTYFAFKTMVQDKGIFIPRTPMNQPLQAECEHFLECIEKNQTPLSDGNSGLRVVRALEAASSSMRNNSIVTAIER